MWKSACQPFISNNTFFQQLRTTHVLKRRNPAPLAKIQNKPNLRRRHLIYLDVSEDSKSYPPRYVDKRLWRETNVLEPTSLKVLLHKYVEDVGRPGDIVEISSEDARILILSKIADYASEENILKAGKKIEPQKMYSSLFAGSTIRALMNTVIRIHLNLENPWTLEPWHIRSAFRRANIHIPDGSFTMPPHPITGPDMSLEGKEFFTVLTINNSDKVPVRCRIYHWATLVKNRIPEKEDFFRFPAETIFPEDVELAKSMNIHDIIPPEVNPDELIKRPDEQTAGIKFEIPKRTQRR